MTPGERNALSRIIKNTFETLLSELETLRLEAIQEAEREFANRVEGTRARREELHQMVNDRMTVILASIKEMEQEAAAEGFEVDLDGYRHYSNIVRSNRISIIDKKHREMLDARKNEIASQYLKAVQILKRRRLEADKDLLLTAIQTEQAKAFMDSLPDAKSLFALALEAS
jgi:hypothetical protein